MGIYQAELPEKNSSLADRTLKQESAAWLTSQRRDTRLDVFRALALLTIFINHVPGTIYEYLTHKNFGFSDSAEAFVLVSGMAVGLAYGRKFTIGQRLPLILKIWRRALTLYYTHILLTGFTLAVFCGGALYMHHSELLREINIAPLMTEPATAFIGIMTLGHQLGYNNILPLYMVLLLFTPLILWSAQRNMLLLLIFSAALYLFAGIYNIAPHNYPTAGLWFLNPLSWQFLFIIGLCAMIWCRKGGHLPQTPLLLAAAIGYLLLSFCWVRWNWWNIDTTFGLFSYNLMGFNKTFLSLPRLVHILALAYVIVSWPRLNNLARVSLSHPLAILGKYSLPVFACGTALAMIGQVLKQLNPTGGLAYDTLLIAMGIIVQFAYAYYLEWLTELKKKNANIGTKNLPAKSAPVLPEASVPGEILAGRGLADTVLPAKS